MSQMSQSADWRPDQAAVCRSCSSPRVVHIAMDLTDGTPVDLVSCLECETRTWTNPAGEVLAISEVLVRAKKPEK
jgi:hypothetical protein